MIAESTSQPTFSAEDLKRNYERLRADLNVVQNELDQALGVWRALLASEKEEYQKLIQDREAAWQRDENQWEQDRQGYENKVAELEKFFKQQVADTEQKAVSALDELDAAWQQERSRWQQTVSYQAKETRQREDLQSITTQQLQQRVAELTDENGRLQTQLVETQTALTHQDQHLRDQIAALEGQVSAWQAEKSSWQQSLSERLHQARLNEEAWTAERQQKDAWIGSLQQELVHLEGRLRQSEATRRSQQQQLEQYIGSLEKQVTSLSDFIQQVIPQMHPLRRKTDHPFNPAFVNTFPRAGN
jgi:chromosome segregation ATPase